MPDSLTSALVDFDGLPVPTAICEVDGTLIEINDATVQLLGRSRDAILGKKAWQFAPGAEHIWTETVTAARDRGIARGDITLAAASGPVVVHYLTAMRPYEGRTLLVLFVLPGDPTSDAMRAANAHAVQWLEALGLVAGGIAHDFNNQLTSVLAEASAARETAGLPTSAVDALRRIEAAATRMAQLTRQLLAYAGRGRFVTELLDPDRLLEEAREQLARLVRFDVDLVIEPAAGRVAIETDRGLLLQVFSNLVANASEAQGGHGAIAISTATKICKDGTSCWQLVVADRGVGMDEQTIERIWDPFFTTKTDHHGLGLSAVIGIVRRLGGEIDVESRPGAGSTFTLRIPAVAGA